ncbi:hypothetical protein QZH41_006527 [Actinostola sp. cb2023]|nr:hypothetical protein QZH41_006527 [Actinostola sp. cb2023]
MYMLWLFDPHTHIPPIFYPYINNWVMYKREGNLLQQQPHLINHHQEPHPSTQYRCKEDLNPKAATHHHHLEAATYHHHMEAATHNNPNAATHHHHNPKATHQSQGSYPPPTGGYPPPSDPPPQYPGPPAYPPQPNPPYPPQEIYFEVIVIVVLAIVVIGCVVFACKKSQTRPGPHSTTAISTTQKTTYGELPPLTTIPRNVMEMQGTPTSYPQGISYPPPSQGSYPPPPIGTYHASPLGSYPLPPSTATKIPPVHVASYSQEIVPDDPPPQYPGPTA